jgi:DNA-directed RNA polymerase specialized sigma24 family protein
LASNEANEQLAADARLVELLRDSGFQGPLWEKFRTHLASYGCSVLRGWVESGQIFKECASHGLSISPRAWPPTSEEADDLVTMTVAKALARFQTRTLAQWNPEGGRSLATWFVGSCLFDFPNVWRSWQRTLHPCRREVSVDPCRLGEMPEATILIVEGPEETVLAERLLACMPEKEDRQIILLTLHGYLQKEIAEILHIRSARAVEGRLRRLRQNLARAAETREED